MVFRFKTFFLAAALIFLSSCRYNADLYDRATAEIDSIPPTVSSVRPADGTAGRGITSPITIYFSELMMNSSLTAETIIVADDSGTVEGRLEITENAGNTYTIVRFYPATDYNSATSGETFTWSTDYELTVTTDARDFYGNSLESERIISFSTAPGLLLVSSSPADGDIGVSGDTSVVLNFNDPVDTGSGWTLDINGTEYSSSSSEAVWNSDNTVLTITPASDFTGGSTVTVDNFSAFVSAGGGAPMPSSPITFDIE